jgi:hypothetical protein
MIALHMTHDEIWTTRKVGAFSQALFCMSKRCQLTWALLTCAPVCNLAFE